MKDKTFPKLLAGLVLLLAGTAVPAAPAPAPDADGYIALHYSDGTDPSVGLDPGA